MKFFPIFLFPVLFFACIYSHKKECPINLFPKYANTPLLSSLKIYPNRIVEKGATLCGMYIDFKFWLGPDSINRKQIFKGILISDGDSILYRREGDSTFYKLFDFSFESLQDSTNTTSTIPWGDSTRTLRVTSLIYNNNTNSNVLECKIQDSGLLDVNETFTFYVAKDLGIIGAYVSMPQYIDKYDKQIIVAYTGDIMLFNLGIGKKVELQRHSGYE